MTASPVRPTAILDANGIIGLAKGGCLSLIPPLFPAIYVPPFVVEEVIDALSMAEMYQALGSWLRKETPSQASMDRVPPLRSAADRQVVGLALDHLPSVVVTSDRKLILQAWRLHVGAIHVPRIVQLLVEFDLIPVAQPVLDRMRDAGFSIPEAEYQEIVKKRQEP